MQRLFKPKCYKCYIQKQLYFWRYLSLRKLQLRPGLYALSFVLAVGLKQKDAAAIPNALRQN